MHPVTIHGGCRDGFCAAWIAHKAMPDAEFVPVQYGQDPPDVLGRRVWILDFSYSRPFMEVIAKDAMELTVLDHHRTAEQALRGWDPPRGLVVFDMERSGAAITWDYFTEMPPEFGEPRTRSWVVEYVQDRDLWRKALPDTEVLNAYISTLPFDFAAWDALPLSPGPSEYIAGRAVLAKTEQYVREVAKHARHIEFEGHRVAIVNAPQVDISELLDSLTYLTGIAMGWWQRADGRFQYSLRSRGEHPIDVSELARRYGGGGHLRAAGFEADAPIHLGWPSR